METEKTLEDDKDQGAINIFLFSNGQEYSPPRKYHLRAEELTWWDATLSYLARSQYGSMHSEIELYTLDGNRLESPAELKNYAVYVAVVTPDAFIQAGYDKYLLKASRSWEKRQSKRISTIEQPQSVEIDTKDEFIVETDKRKDSTNIQTLDHSIPLEALVTNNVEVRPPQRISVNTPRKISDVRKISVVSKPDERRKSTPYQVSQRPNNPRKISTKAPVELTTKRLSLSTRMSIPGKISTDISAAETNSSSIPIRVQKVLHKVDDRNRSHLSSKSRKLNNTSKIEIAINEVKAQMKDKKSKPVNEALQSKPVNDLKSIGLNNAKIISKPIEGNTIHGEVTSIEALENINEIKLKSDTVKAENKVINSNSSMVSTKNLKDYRKESLRDTINHNTLVSNTHNNLALVSTAILDKISEKEPSEITNQSINEVDNVTKIENGGNKRYLDSILGALLPSSIAVDYTVVENQIINTKSPTRLSKPMNNVLETQILENDCIETNIEPCLLMRITDKFLITSSNDETKDIMNETTTNKLPNPIDINPINTNIINNYTERKVSPAKLMIKRTSTKNDTSPLENLIENSPDVKDSTQRKLFLLKDHIQKPETTTPSDNAVKNVYKNTKCEVNSILTETDSIVLETEKEDENKDGNIMPLVIFQSAPWAKISEQNEDQTESDRHKIVILVDKGDVINLKFKIEVHNAEGILKTSKKEKTRNLRSFSNLKNDDSNNDDMLTQSKSLQSIENECPPHQCCRKDQRMVVVNCGCCGYRSQEDTQYKAEIKELGSDIQPCYVLLPVITQNRKCSKMCPNIITKTCEKQVQNTESLNKVNVVHSFRKTVISLPSQIANTSPKMSLGSHKEIEKHEYASKRQVSIVSDDNVPSEMESMKTNPSQSAKLTDNYANADCICVNKRASNTWRGSGCQDKSTQTDWCDVVLEARAHSDGHYTFHLPPLQVLRHYKV